MFPKININSRKMWAERAEKGGRNMLLAPGTNPPPVRHNGSERFASIIQIKIKVIKTEPDNQVMRKFPAFPFRGAGRRTGTKGSCPTLHAFAARSGRRKMRLQQPGGKRLCCGDRNTSDSRIEPSEVILMKAAKKHRMLVTRWVVGFWNQPIHKS